MLALANERIRIMKVIFDDTRCRHCCHTFRIPDFGVSVTSVLQPCSGLIICVEFHRFTVTLTVTHILLPLHALGALVITSLVVVHGPSNQSRAQPGRGGGWVAGFVCLPRLRSVCRSTVVSVRLSRVWSPRSRAACVSYKSYASGVHSCMHTLSRHAHLCHGVRLSPPSTIFKQN